MQLITSNPNGTWQADAEQGLAGDSAKVDGTLTVTGHEDQTWEGWGACFNELGWIALNKLPEEKREAILREFFHPQEGCRFNFCRLPIGASDYAAQWYSHNEHAGDYAMEQFSVERDEKYLIPYIRAAKRYFPGLKLFASPWSPPTWMKFPPVYNYGRLIQTEENLRAYALYLVKFLQAYACRGLPIAQLHVQNEPVADQKFPSCVWTGEEMRDFIRDYLAPAFKEAGVDTGIWLGTLNTDDYDGFVHTVLSDERACASVAGIGLQWAGKGMVQRVRLAWPQKPVIQTENECGNGTNTWAYAHYVYRLFWHYITNGVVAYTYWNMVLEPGGESTWGWKQNSLVTVDPQNGEVHWNPEFFVMKHFSHFVERGARRLAVSNNFAANSVAFRNPDGQVVVVLENPFRRRFRVGIEAEGRERVVVELPEFGFATLVLDA
ncbi:MAG: glycosyl hydrolase [Lentisphaerae bacterium]|nr:MAG: glycosyl hydrolase [Lentisphaerota bacterium]